MGKYVMALDQGTTSSRCILFDVNGMICSMAQKEFTQVYPKPGWVEHDPEEFLANTLTVLKEVIKKAGIDKNDVALLRALADSLRKKEK